MDVMRNSYLVQLFLLYCLVDNVNPADVLLCPGRKHDLYIQCDSTAWMSVEEAVAGYVPDPSSCETTTEREQLINTAPPGCTNVTTEELHSCQGDHFCGIDCKAGMRQISSCAESSETNTLYIKYSCYKDATAFVIMGSLITFMVLLVFITFGVKSVRETMRKRKREKRRLKRRAQNPDKAEDYHSSVGDAILEAWVIGGALSGGFLNQTHSPKVHAGGGGAQGNNNLHKGQKVANNTKDASYA